MSLEEKVGQLLMVNFHGERVNDDAKILVQEIKVGGIIYYNWANGLTSPEQIQMLSDGLQDLTKNNRIAVPLLIATDQEGGVVSRLQSGFTSFPGNRALGETKDPLLAKAAAFAMGEELQAVGINMNLAPVVDINSNPRNPVIGVRSFGESAKTVIAFGKQALLGFKQAHVLTTLKHFPGHGDVSIDSHEDLPVIHSSKQELEKVELLPFAKLASSADAIMTAHILVPALDPDNCSTLSEKTLNYLREVIGFQGVILSDSLAMNGVLKKCHSIDEAAIMALQAGCDMLILGGKFLIDGDTKCELSATLVRRIHSSIVGAVKSGRLSECKINEAVQRVLKLKERYIHSTDHRKKVYTVEHRALAREIASRALTVIDRKSDHIFPLRDKNIFVLAPTLLRSTIENTSFCTLGKSTKVCFFNDLESLSIEQEVVKQQATTADLIIVFSYNAWKSPSTIAVIKCLLRREKPLILLSVRDPLDADLFPSADLVFKSFSPTAPSLQAICDYLDLKI